MKTSKIVKFSAVSTVLFTSLVPLGHFGGMQIKLLLASIFYFIITWLLLKRCLGTKEIIITLFIILLPPTILYLPIHIIHYRETQQSLPSTVAHYLGTACALIAYHSGKIPKITIAISLLIFSIWVAYAGYDLWINNLNYGTFTGNVNYKIPMAINGYTQTHYFDGNKELKGKVVLVDFWNTGCGICFAKFPIVQRIFDKYRNSSKISILAINKPLDRDSSRQAFAVLKQNSYTFPVLIPDNKNLPERFGVLYYPTTIVIDTYGNVIYKGDIEGASQIVDHLR